MRLKYHQSKHNNIIKQQKLIIIVLKLFIRYIGSTYHTIVTLHKSKQKKILSGYNVIKYWES